MEISPDDEIESLVYIQNISNNYFLAISENEKLVVNKFQLAEKNGEK